MVVANVPKADSVLSEYLLLQQKAADRNGWAAFFVMQYN